MKHIFYIVLFTAALLSGAAPGFFAPHSFAGEAGAGGAGPQEFFQAMDDLPLMPGLHEAPDETVTFDKPDGRIIEMHAYSERLTAEDVARFYAEALQQMGWAQGGAGRFLRGTETLLLDTGTDNGVLSVSFRIIPGSRERD